MAKEHKNFCLNFNNEEQIVSVELIHKDGIISIANAFSKWLTENGIAHQVSTQFIKEEDESNTN